jgi:hypothetical protein
MAKNGYENWTPKQAARVGYLAGRGYPAEIIATDSAIGPRTRGSIQHVITRWRLRSGGGAIALSDAVLTGLAKAACSRRVSVEALALQVLHRAVDDSLISAILDDGK